MDSLNPFLQVLIGIAIPFVGVAVFAYFISIFFMTFELSNFRCKQPYKVSNRRAIGLMFKLGFVGLRTEANGKEAFWNRLQDIVDSERSNAEDIAECKHLIAQARSFPKTAAVRNNLRSLESQLDKLREYDSEVEADIQLKVMEDNLAAFRDRMELYNNVTDPAVRHQKGIPM